MAAAPNGYRWFQLYVYRDRKLSEQMVHRVEALGYKALVLTVDVPYTGKRRNDIRNQFKLPPHLKVKNFDGVFQVTANSFLYIHCAPKHASTFLRTQNELRQRLLIFNCVFDVDFIPS